MTNRLVVVFGDLRGWDDRLMLHVETPTLQNIYEPNQTKTFAKVRIGPADVLGPIALDREADDGTRTIVVYAGHHIPQWAGEEMPSDFGWTQTEDLPVGIDAAREEVDILLLRFDDTAHVHGWTRTVWLPYAPRPMEHVTFTTGNGEGEPVNARVLEIGRDVTSQGRDVPFAIVTCVDEPPVADLLAHGWVNEPWVAEKRATWWSLHLLSDAIEAHAQPLLGNAVVGDVTIHDITKIESVALPLLPRDVRDALEASLEALPD